MQANTPYRLNDATLEHRKWLRIARKIPYANR